MMKNIFFLLITAFSINVFAAQFLEADENRPLQATISSNAMSRISIEGGTVINVGYLEEELELEWDKVAGQIYVTPVTGKKNINLFVTSSSNKTYLLNLNTTGKMADSIVIREKSAQIEQLQKFQQTQARIPQAVSNKQDNYIRSIKAFLIAIANNNTAGFGVQVTPSYAEVPLWKEVLFIRKNRYAAADLYAESYTITNITKQPIVLAEQEFYKARVLAVAIRKQQLAPGEQTEVFIISSNGGL